MSFEVFDKLEAKVQQTLDTITLLQMEIEELKGKNNQLVNDINTANSRHQELERENALLQESQQQWQDRLQALLGKMEEM